MPFKKGQVANPTGRPKGSRNKLSESFLGDLNKFWAIKGEKAIEEAFASAPIAIIKVIAQVLPKEINISHAILEKLDEMTDDDIRAELRRLDPTSASLPTDTTTH